MTDSLISDTIAENTFELSIKEVLVRIPNTLSSRCVTALSQSMDSHIMIVIARIFIPDYNIYERTGFPSSIAIPNRNVAKQVVADICNHGLFLDFVLLLISFQEKGYMGRKYAIPYLREILNGVLNLGFLYDKENKIFVENPAYRKTRNWGFLKTGKEYTLAFLRLDIVGNSVLVRKYPKEIIDSTYSALRNIIQQSVEKRNGRIWSMEGDGGLAAFCFANKNQCAALSAIEIIHELLIYNHTKSKLEKPFNVRIAVHSGAFEYTDNEEILKRSDTIKRIIEIESKHTKPGTVTISTVVKVMLDSIVTNEFKIIQSNTPTKYYNYTLTME